MDREVGLSKLYDEMKTRVNKNKVMALHLDELVCKRHYINFVSDFLRQLSQTHCKMSWNCERV